MGRPIFASSDIAALIAAYPPPLLEKGKPSVIRSLSRNDAIHSRDAIVRLRSILETEPAPIRIAELQQRLNVENIEPVLNCYDDRLYYSKDRQSLVSVPRIQSILNALHDRIRREFLRLNDLSDRYDLSLPSLDLLLEAEISQPICRLVDNGETVIASEAHCNEVRIQIASSIAQTPSSERVRLTKMHPEIPTDLLYSLGKEALDREANMEGTFEKEGNELLFTPSGYVTAQEVEAQREYSEKIASFLETLDSQGFCIVPSSSNAGESNKGVPVQLPTDVLSAYKEKHPDAEVIRLSHNDSTVIALGNTAMQTLGDMIQNTTLLIKEDWPKAGPASSFNEAFETSLITRSSKPVVASAIAKDDTFRNRIEDAYRDGRDLLLSEEVTRIAELFREEVAAPLQLYADGVGSVSDATLVEHLDEYVCDHFRRECIPQTITTFRGLSLLWDKARNRDTEKLLAACNEAKTLEAVQNAVQRFMRKQKIDSPSIDLLQMSKNTILNQKSKAMKSMTRGSDVLQNLVWVLLGQSQKGLFMSSGKDTSRMIKQYERVGEREKSVRLLQLRDALKAGDVSADELEDMRRMAREAVS